MKRWTFLGETVCIYTRTPLLHHNKGAKQALKSCWHLMMGLVCWSQQSNKGLWKHNWHSSGGLHNMEKVKNYCANFTAYTHYCTALLFHFLHSLANLFLNKKIWVTYAKGPLGQLWDKTEKATHLSWSRIICMLNMVSWKQWMSVLLRNLFISRYHILQTNVSFSVCCL